tara:strand:+ start:1580 stop:2065 length:486 start_codon:yes stop_codon:yes gene_type:complete
MATKVTPATLTVKVSEAITLNGVSYGGSNTFTKSSCGQVDQRIMSVAHNSNVEIASLEGADAKGAVVAANLKYFRVTNLDDTNFISVILYKSGADYNEAAIKVEAGSSLFFTTDDFFTESNTADHSSDLAADFGGSLLSFDKIYLRADTAACDCEYIVVTT